MDAKGKGQRFNNETQMRWNWKKGKSAGTIWCILKNGKVLLCFFAFFPPIIYIGSKKKQIFDVIIRNETKNHNKLFYPGNLLSAAVEVVAKKNVISTEDDWKMFLSLIDFGETQPASQYIASFSILLLSVNANKMRVAQIEAKEKVQTQIYTCSS